MLKIVPRIQNWFDSLPITVRYRRTIGTVALSLFAIGVLILLVLSHYDAFSSHSSQIAPREWYDEGTLLDKSALDWQVATNGDKLATCGKLMASLLSENSLKTKLQSSIHSADELRSYAAELAAFVNAATKKQPDDDKNWKMYANQSVREIAMIALSTNGYLAPKAPTNSPSQIASDLIATYSVIEAKTLAGSKKTLVIRLNQRVSEDMLRAIATKLKDSDPKQFRLTYIAFYLPGMVVGTGAWATAEFGPNLKVTIIGMTVDQENALKRLPNNPSRQMIGSWWDERPGLGNKMTFFRENGKVFMERKFPDGSGGVDEMWEAHSSSGRRLAYKPDNGEYFIINANGELEWWDEDGQFLTSRKAD